MKVNKSNFSEDISERMFDKFTDVLRQHLMDGNTVKLKNVGTLSTVRKPAKSMIVAGVSREVKEHIKIKFTPSRNFKKNIVKSKDEKSISDTMEELVKQIKL